MSDGLCRWICRPPPEEEPQGLPPHGAEVGQGLARSRRARVSGMRRRRCQNGKMDVVPAQRQAQARRDGGMVLHRVQVARASRPRQRQSHEGPAAPNMMNPKAMPFDGKRMIYGGFKVLIDV